MRLFTLLLTSTMTVMAAAIISPALTKIHANFAHIANSQFLIKMFLTMQAIFVVFSSPVAGYISDKFGRKKLLAYSIVLYGIGGSSGLYLDSLFGLFAGRALLGIAIGGILTVNSALIVDYFDPMDQRRVFGYRSSTISFSGVLFLLFGGILSDISWRAPFAIYLSAFIMLPFAIMYLPEPKRSKETKNNNKSTFNGNFFPLLMIYSLAAVSIVFFYLIPVQLPFLLKEVFNANGTQSGLALSFSTLSAGFAALLYKRVRARLNPRQISIMVYALMGIANLIIAVAGSYYQIIIAMLINGLGMGLMLPNFNIWAGAYSSEHNRGRILGMLASSLFLGMFISPIFVQPIQASLGVAGAFAVASIILFSLSIGFLVSVLMRMGKAKKSQTI